MAIEFGKLGGQPGDIPKRKVTQEVTPLTAETHGAVVRELVTITNRPGNVRLAAIEVHEFDGVLDDGTVVGKGIDAEQPLGDGKYTSSAFVSTYNEAWAV